MKNIWSFLLGMLFWESIALRKNPRIAEKLKNQISVTTKLKTIFLEIIHLNKKVVEDIEDIDYQWGIQDIKTYMQAEIEHLENKITTIKDWISESISSDHQEILSNLYDQYSQLKKTISNTMSQFSSPKTPVKKIKKSISPASKTKKTASTRKK